MPSNPLERQTRSKDGLNSYKYRTLQMASNPRAGEIQSSNAEGPLTQMSSMCVPSTRSSTRKAGVLTELPVGKTSELPRWQTLVVFTELYLLLYK